MGLCTLRPRCHRSSTRCVSVPTARLAPLDGPGGTPLSVPVIRTVQSPMTLTVGDLLRIPELDLRLVAGEGGTGGAIRWVHSTELPDPTPFLKGGELLLTTGIGVGKSAAQQRAYVERLARAGLAGLGLGLGFDFARTPKSLIAAADREGFPVFEVPYPDAVHRHHRGRVHPPWRRAVRPAVPVAGVEHTLTRAVLDGKGSRGSCERLIRRDRRLGGAAGPPGRSGGPVAEDGRGGASPACGRRAPGAPERRCGSACRWWTGEPPSPSSPSPARVGTGGLSRRREEGGAHASSTASSRPRARAARVELSKARAVTETERRMKGDVLEPVAVRDIGRARPVERSSAGVRLFSAR